MNEITEKEIFTLKPGRRRVLGDWLRAPEAPAGHIVRLSYDNDPKRDVRGLLLGGSSPSPAAMARIRGSTACRLESDLVTVR